MTPLQSSSIPLQTSAVGVPGVALQTVPAPLGAQTQVPVARQAPTPTVQVVPIAPPGPGPQETQVPEASQTPVEPAFQW